MNNNRRGFIKKLGGIGGAGLLASVPAILVAETMETKDMKEMKETRFGDKPFTISILQTTDVHCQVYPHDELFWENDKAVFRKTGGYANLATYLQKQRKKNPNTFLIDTGDMFQGSELAVKTSGKAMVPVLNALGYDLYLPGNWEVVYYKKNMQTLLGSLTAPKVCANMFHDLGYGKKGELIFPPYYIWNVRGVKIGFVGYTDPLVPIRQSPAYSKGIIYGRPEENLAYYVDVLHNQEQCAYVFVLSHLGLSQQINLANMEECKGVDYILGGDTHERVRKPIQCKYSKVVEPGAFGSFVGKLNLTIQNAKVIKDEYELEELTSDKFPPSEEITSLIKQHEKPFSDEIYKVAGYSTIPLFRYFVVENPIDTLILDALKWTIPEMDIVLSNGFRFCPPRATPDHTGNIPITEGFLYDMLPVDSTVRTGTVKGTQIKEWLERELNNVFAKNASERLGGWLIKFKGMKISFNAFADKDKRIQDIFIGDVRLDMEKTYRICACEREGDPEDVLCRITGVQNAKNTNHTLHSVLREYLVANSPVTPTPPLNARILDGPQTLLSQVTGVDYKFR